MDLATFIESQWGSVFTLTVLVILLLAAVYAAALKTPGRDARRWILAALLGGLVIASLWVRPALARMLLLDAGALALVALVWIQDRKAGWLYLVAVLAGSALVAAGMAVGGLFDPQGVRPGGDLDKLVVVLLMLGFALKLALVPFYFWLPALAENTSPITAVLVISVLDMAEIGELVALRSYAAWVFTGWQTAWLVMALLAMFGGALLALSQRSLRRMLAFSAIDDSGYLLLGVVAGSQLGIAGVLLGALSHALCKFLLFAALGSAENGLGRHITLDQRGLANRFPVSAAAFIVGALGMVGVPPFLGAAGRWRLYLTGIELGGWPLAAAMALASILALLYYVRAVHQVWLGKADAALVGSEPRPVAWVLATGILLVIAAGAFLAFGAGLGVG
jgi:multicomponent Na+:H+ antiporter subunit D